MDAYGKRVLERIKVQGGPDLGEDILKVIWSASMDELVVEVNANDVVWDNILAGPIEAVKEIGLKALDKIDGKEG